METDFNSCFLEFETGLFDSICFHSFNSCKQNLKAAGRLMPKISFSEQGKFLVFSVQWCVSCKLFILIYKALHGLRLSDETVLITTYCCCLPDCLWDWISLCQSQSISPLFFCLVKFSFHDKSHHSTEALKKKSVFWWNHLTPAARFSAGVLLPVMRVT